MSDDKAKELEKDIADINIKLDTLQKGFDEMYNLMKSNSELKTVGYSEQQKINTKDISQLKIDKKILLGVGAVVGGLISASFWLLTRLKNLV
jgi:uncharacterized protein YoxC